MGLFSLFGSDLAIDLGSANTLVFHKKKGIILNEASQVAMNIDSGEVVAIGNKAKEMIGKSPQNIAIINPLEKGTVSDFDFTKILIKYCIDKASGGISIIQPRVVVTAPSGVTDIELRAIEDACIHSGAREVYILESAIANALGAGFDISKSEGRFIVDLGAGNTDISIVSLFGIVISKNIKLGGDNLDTAIQNFVYDKYSIVLGINTVKELKLTLGSVIKDDQNRSIEVSGRDALSGMPVSLDIFESDVREAIMESIYEIIDNIKYVLEKNPPEQAKDILQNGIFITGGGSQIRGLDQLIQDSIGIRVFKSENPLEDTINGAGIVLRDLNKYKSIGK